MSPAACGATCTPGWRAGWGWRRCCETRRRWGVGRSALFRPPSGLHPPWDRRAAALMARKALSTLRDWGRLSAAMVDKESVVHPTDHQANKTPIARPRCQGTVLQLDPGGLDLGVLVEGVQRLVSAVAGLLEAAERRGHVAAVVLIDPHAAGTQGLGHPVRPRQIAGPHRRGQAIGRVVGNAHRLLGAVEADHREHR